MPPTDLDAPNPTPHQPPVLPGDQVTCIQAGAPGAPIPGAIYTVAAVHEDDRNEWSVRLHPRTLGDAPSGLWPAINFIRNEPPTVHNAPGFTNGLMDHERDLPTVAATLAQLERGAAPLDGAAPIHSATSPHQERAARDVGRGFQSPHMPTGAYPSTVLNTNQRSTMSNGPIRPAEMQGEHAITNEPVPRPACLNCEHSRPAAYQPAKVHCHGKPPNADADGVAVWPLVSITDVCGAWRLKATDNPPTPSP